MTTDPQVTHPPVTHPETATPTTPPAADRQQAKQTSARPARRALRLPPPKVIAAAALAVTAMELLVWQVGGLFWGGVIHGVLLIIIGLCLLVWMRWRSRRDARLALGRAVGQAARAAGGQQPGRSRLGRMFGGAGSGTAAGPARRSLLSRLTGGRRTGGGMTGSGSGRSGGLLSRLGRAGSASRRTGAGTGRAGGLLGRFGRSTQASGAGRSAGTGTASRRTGLRSAIGRSLLDRARAAGAAKPKNNASKPAGRSAQVRRGAVAAFLRGVREGAQAKKTPKEKPNPAQQAKPAPKPEAVAEKPQPPTRDELVKEAVEKAAGTAPAPVASSRRSRGTTVGSMRDILASAEDLAGQLKAYDEDDMHVFVRELPQLAEALAAIEGGIKMMASRAESEWPLAGPVVEALHSVASDVKAAAGTVGEAKAAVHRENETDIERGEAPRQGERRWNV